MANYFVWMADMELVGKCAHFLKEPENFELEDWISGVPMKQHGTMTLVTDEQYDTKLTDMLLTRFTINVFSEKLRKVLEDVGVKNIEYHPVEVVNHETDEVIETYSAANILGHIACLDEENSTISRSRQDDSIIELEEFAIDDSRVIPTPHMHNKALMFRLEEFPFVLMAAESVKDAVEECGITGVEFVPPDEYIG